MEWVAHSYVPPTQLLFFIRCESSTQIFLKTFMKNAMTYILKMSANRPILTGLFTVVLTVAFGMSLAFATGFVTPSEVLADVLPPCCVTPPPPPPPTPSA